MMIIKMMTKKNKMINKILQVAVAAAEVNVCSKMIYDYLFGASKCVLMLINLSWIDGVESAVLVVIKVTVIHILFTGFKSSLLSPLNISFEPVLLLCQKVKHINGSVAWINALYDQFEARLCS